MKTGIFKKLTIALCLFALIAAAAFACVFDMQSADALSFGDKELSSLWYYGDSGLKLGSAKAVVDSWNKGGLTQKTIAVIDTGIDYAHEVFGGVLCLNGEGKPIGYDARQKKEVTLDSMLDNAAERKDNTFTVKKHGNAIAGVIAMMIKELGLQNYVKIYPIKANSIVIEKDNPAERATFSVENVVEAIKQAQRIGASVINLSLGIIKSENTNGEWVNNKDLKYALEDACKDSLIVAAAGNDKKNSDEKDGNLFYPAAHDGVLGVMAYGENGLYVDSNYGSAYGIAAPGEQIYTAKYAETNSYQTLDGTSLATPAVAVAGALIKLRYEAEGKSVPDGIAVARMLRNLTNVKTVTKGGYTAKCLDFHSVLTQDFENTSYVYDDPVGIGISHNGTYGKDAYDNAIYMRANEVVSVTFIAKINPYGNTDPALDSAVQWIEKRRDFSETVIGYGLRLEYTPTVIDQTVTIIARLRFGSETFEQSEDVRVASVAFMIGEARVTFEKNSLESVDTAPSEGVLYTGETYTFSLTGIRYVSPLKKSQIKWYVNDEHLGTGETFKYSPKTSGKFIVSARYDGKLIPRVFEADVKSFILRPLDLSMLIISIAILIALAGIITAVAVKRKSSAKTE